MKCPACGGTGKVVHPMMTMNGDEYTGEWEQHECEACNGTGEVEMTEQEWLQTATTEQLAEFLFRIAYMCSYCGDEAHSSQEKMQQCYFGKCGCRRKDWEMWLKQPHNNE